MAAAQDQARITDAIARKDWAAAERLLRRRTARPGATGADFYNLGGVLVEMGQHRFALTALRRAAKMLPNEPGVWLQLGRAALGEKDLALAARAFGKCAELDPSNRAARLNYGKLSLRLGDWETARRVLKEFDGPEAKALAYRAAAELGEPVAADELAEMLKSAAFRPAAFYAMAKTARGRIPLRIALDDD